MSTKVPCSFRNGKPVERQGRKATGLKHVSDAMVAGSPKKWGNCQRSVHPFSGGFLFLRCKIRGRRCNSGMTFTMYRTMLEKDLFFHMFQPIYNLTNWQKTGMEVLFRSSLFAQPQYPFQIARKNQCLYELETKSMEKLFAEYRKANGKMVGRRLFINVYPSTLANCAFRSFILIQLEKNELSPNQIVFEINEDETVTDSQLLKEAIENLKETGCQIAIDDVGKGAASMRNLVELEPQFVKLDMYFAKDLAFSAHKQEMVKSISTFCENIGALLILEGLETAEDLAAAKSLGVKYGQGYILGRPAPLDAISF